jgi:hypothetical protein
MKAKDSKSNLCEKCMFDVPTCGSQNIKFGDGVGNDNVIECSNFLTKNFKTPIEEIFFRSSKIGLLAGGLIRHGLTEKQREEMEALELAKRTPIGLTEKQQAELDDWNAKVKDGKTLTPSQMQKRDDYKNRLKQPKGLTPTQNARLWDLKERNARPPELSQGAKTYIKEVWLENEKGFKEEVTDKKLRKGLQAEEDAINLISFVDGIMYVKNEKREYKNHITGEADVITEFKDMEVEGSEKTVDALVIDDTKCSWNPRTFMQASLTTGYEWQGRAYLYLYNADIFRLRHCLVDCPPDVFADEYKRFCFQHGIIDDTLPEYQEAIEQFKRNYLYEDSDLYTKEERVKTFSFVRDYELEEVLLTSVKLGVEYYKTITLNMIENE